MDVGIKMVKCSVCGKDYVYNHMSIYKIKVGDSVKNCCSYTCYRKLQKEKENSKQAKREQRKIQKELEG